MVLHLVVLTTGPILHWLPGNFGSAPSEATTAQQLGTFYAADSLLGPIFSKLPI